MSTPTATRKHKIGLFCDRRDWILGTEADQTVRWLAPTHKFDFHISSQRDIFLHPLRELVKLSACDVIHWISTYGYFHFSPLFSPRAQICSLHHIMPEDDNWPTTYPNVVIVTMSNRSKDDLLQRGFTDVEVVRNGVDTDIFRPLDRTICRQHLNLAEVSQPLVGFFGKESSNPDDRKGTRTLIQTLKTINQHYSVGLVLSGEGWNTLKAELLAANIAVFHRPVEKLEDMPWLYGAIDLYLCTSRIEGGPVTVLEAMACERPVVTTPVGHAPELIRDGENGLMIPLDDAPAAVQAAENILNYHAFAQQLAQAARQTILQEWNWQVVMAPLAEIYETTARLSVYARRSWPATGRAFALLIARSLKYRIRYK